MVPFLQGDDSNSLRGSHATRQWATPQRKVWFIGWSICYTTNQFPWDVTLPGSPVVFIDVPERERNGPDRSYNNYPLESAGKAETR